MPSRSIIRTGVGPHREPGNRFPAMAAINLLAARAARVQSRRNLSRSLSPKLDHSHSITRFDRSRTGPYLAHVWAKRGADLRIPAPGQAAKVAMLGVLDWAQRELIVHTSRTKRSADFIALLEEVDRRYGPKLGVAIQPLVLVLDNGPIHTSKASRAALAARAHWLRVEWLPK